MRSRNPVLVAGGGIAGLGLAIGLARGGRRVVLVDPDDLMPAATPDDAFALERRGAPQVRHTHGLLARLTLTLGERYPDVLQSLLEVGGVEVDLAERFGDHQPGDEQMRVLLARRTTLEWALRRAAVAEPGIEIRSGVRVISLAGGPESVTGARLDTGEVVKADTVVAAGGRRAGVTRWLSELGVDLPEEERDTGIVYLTRWYRTTDAWARVMAGDDLVKLGGDLGYLFYLAVPADPGTFSLTLAVGAHDDRLRSQLLSSVAFDRAVAALPLPEGLLDKLAPVGPVHPMGSLVNRIRRFLSPDGEPLITGFHAVGDAHTCTNPIYGRGCSLALVQAAALVDAMARHPDDPVRRSQAYEAACGQQTEPWYDLSVQGDQVRRARARTAESGGEVAPSPIELLFSVGSDDPVVGRAIIRAVNLLATPQQLMTDPAVLARAMELTAAARTEINDLSADGEAPPAPANRWARNGPTRQEMLDLTFAARGSEPACQ